MQSVTGSVSADYSGAPWRRRWPLLVGVISVLGTSYLRFVHNLWSVDEYSHGPLIIAIAVFLFWRKRREFAASGPTDRAGGAFLLLGTGLVLYLLGARMASGFLESFSHVVVLAATIWLYGGRSLLRATAGPLLFLLLSVPLPGTMLAAATGSLKQLVSASAEGILYAAGYPIARSGVVLTIGGYQLLIADACSGMNSIFSLAAIAFLYLQIMPPRRSWERWFIVAAILPIALIANVVRVMALVLITYYLGDEAGQGFLHEFAGFVLFTVAVGTLAAIHSGLNWFDLRGPIELKGGNSG